MNDRAIDSGGRFAGTPGGVLPLLEGRSRTVLAAALVGLFAGALASFILPPWYESTARLAVIPVEDPTASFGTNVLDGSNATLPIVVAVLKSRTVADETVAQLGLQSVYGQKTPQAAREVLVQHLTVSTDRKSNLITVSAEDHTPERARAIAELVSSLAAAKSAELWSARNHEQRANLQAELAEAQALLRAAEGRRRAFRDRAGIVDLPSQLRATVEEAAALEKLRIDQRVELRFARAFSAENAVEVQRVAAQKSAAARELDHLRRHGAAPFLALDELPALETEEAQHRREIDQLSARGDLLALKLSQLAAADTRSGGRAESIDSASLSIRPSRPSLLALGGQGAALGALLSALFLVLSRRRRH